MTDAWHGGPHAVKASVRLAAIVLLAVVVLVIHSPVRAMQLPMTAAVMKAANRDRCAHVAVAMGDDRKAAILLIAMRWTDA